MMLNVLSDVCMISVLLYWPTPLALKAFTLDLYVLLKWSPSTVQMVSVPTYTSCKDTQALPVKVGGYIRCVIMTPNRQTDRQLQKECRLFFWGGIWR